MTSPAAALPWRTFLALVAVLAAFVYISVAFDARESRCVALGGELTRVARSFVCLSPDGRIIQW